MRFCPYPKVVFLLILECVVGASCSCIYVLLFSFVEFLLLFRTLVDDTLLLIMVTFTILLLLLVVLLILSFALSIHGILMEFCFVNFSFINFFGQVLLIWVPSSPEEFLSFIFSGYSSSLLSSDTSSSLYSLLVHFRGLVSICFDFVGGLIFVNSLVKPM